MRKFSLLAAACRIGAAALALALPADSAPAADKLDKPYAPLMAVIGGGCLGPLSDEQVLHIANTWKMVNSHGGMLDHRDPSRGQLGYWAGPSCGKDAQGRTILQRIKAIRPDFIASNYRNGSYVAQFSPHEAGEVESRFPLAISVWNTETTLLREVGAEETTLLVSKPPQETVPRQPQIAGGRPETYPFKQSSTEAEHSETTKAYVAWIRLGDEIVRIDRARTTGAGIELTVRRAIWTTHPAPHARDTAVFQPVYIGRNTGIAAGDSGLGGRPDDPSPRPGLRYALMTFDPEMHTWLGEKARAIFDEGYDVCWLDVSVSTWYNNANAFGDEVHPWDIRKGAPLTQEDYRRWQQRKNDALLARFPNGKFWINNMKGDVYFDRGRDREQLSGGDGHRAVHGGSMEMYANHRGNESAWRQTLDMTLDMVTSGFHAVAWAKGRKDPEYRRFAYATYLLAYQQGAEFYFAAGEGEGILRRPSDLFYYDLGTPTESFAKAAEAQSPTAPGLYERDFTKAKVVVNPGKEPKQLELEKAYADPVSGTRTTTVSLPGNTAAILLIPQP